MMNPKQNLSCAGCKNSITDKSYVKCTQNRCDKHFHFLCVGLSGPATNSWVCPDCYSSKRKGGDNSATPVRPSENITYRKQKPSIPLEQTCHDTTLRSELSGGQGKVDSISQQFTNLREEVRKMLTDFSTTQGNELKKVTLALKEVQQSNHNIEKSVAFLTAQNEEFKKKIGQLEIQIKEDKQLITSLENKIEDMQMGSRKTNFEIKNVPKKNNETREDLIDMVMCLSHSIDCNVTKSDIKDIYRVRAKKSEKTNTPIIVETGSTLLKTDILKMSKSFNIKHKTKLCVKHLGIKTQEDTPVFLTEHLTVKGSRLHFLARDLAKSKAYRFCWTAYGKVYVRKDERSPVITIRSEEQVHHLLLEA